MVQTNMGVRSVAEEIIDAVPCEQKIKKQITIDSEFVERQFICIPVGSERVGLDELERKHYKEPRYLGPWFKVSGYV